MNFKIKWKSLFQVEDRQDYYQKRFVHNNKFILALAIYLVLEQIYYGFFTAETGSMRQIVFFTSGFIMTCYAFASGLFALKKEIGSSLFHRLYSVSFGLVGIVVAVVRSLMFRNDVFALPTIYIAVIYGFAVFFIVGPGVSAAIYCLTSIVMVFAYPYAHPDYVNTTFIQDILTNNLIALIASWFNYMRSLHDYRSAYSLAAMNQELLDKTEQIQKNNKELLYHSNYDGLTNIYNRRKLNENLEQVFWNASSLKKEMSIILMDIDYFKLVNDTFGHSAGDHVLIELGKILRSNVRQKDVVGRWGGEEFLVICPDTDAETAVEIAERIRGVIESYDFGLPRPLTCSFGVTNNQDIEETTAMIIQADNSLYAAKAGGRNRVCALSRAVV